MADTAYDLYMMLTDGTRQKVGTIVAPSNPPPVNWVVITTDNVSPAQHYSGTTWEKIAQGRTLIGASDEYVLGSSGGETIHKLTISEMPTHNHTPITSGLGQTLASNYGTATNLYGGVDPNTGNLNYPYHDSDVGGSLPHNNMQPYLVINYWKRIY